MPLTLIERNTPAMKMIAQAKQSLERKKQPLPKWLRLMPLVPVYEFDEELVTPTSTGYKLKKQTDDWFAEKVTVHNISDRDVAGLIWIPDSPLMDYIALEPGQNMTTHFSFKMDPNQPSAHYDVNCQGEQDTETYDTIPDSGSGRWCFVFRYIIEPTWDGLLEKHPNNLPLDISPEQWMPSSSGTMNIDAAEDSGVILKCTFGDGDKWCYPRLAVPEGVDLAEYGGVILRARAWGETTPRLFLHERDTGAGYMTEASLFPADGEWHAVRISFDRLVYCGATPADPNGRLDLDKVNALSVGFNTQSREATLEIGDCVLVRR